jgi:dTDP-4-amino-4,6-dideoxygalactose transaminase
VLKEKGILQLPTVPTYASNNAHMFYIVCSNLDERTRLIEHLKSNDISAVFHYLSLHISEFYKDKHDGRKLPVSDKLTDCLLRLPFHFELKEEEILFVCKTIKNFFKVN